MTTLPNGEAVPVLGQGTWNMGAHRTDRAEEVAALKLGLDLGMTLIDTAEMYADGGAEEVVGEAIAGRREQTFVVGKVLPKNATRARAIAACERSLKRLKTDRIDLYLLHWRESVPLIETVEGFAELKRAEKIRHWGVSNFDIDDMEELTAIPGGAGVASNQVMYNLNRRGIEYDLMPWCGERGIPVMAYSPLDQGRLLRSGELARIAARHKANAAQVALAWLTGMKGVISIPKARNGAHVRENRAALDIALTAQDLGELERAFPRPARKRPLAMT